MLIKFKHLIIENFLSFGYSELDLNDRGYTLIEGINKNPVDNASSNGSGKSTIADAICYCITGETIRGINKNLVNIHTSGGMRVELTFEVDEIPYKIIRTKDHKEYGTTVKLFVNGEDKSGKGVRDTEKIIEEYLPDLTSSLIGSVIILGQGMPQRFTNNTPSGRKEVLEKLSKSDFMIEDVKNRLTQRKIELAKQSKDKEIEIASLSSKRDVYNRQLVQYKDQLENLSSPEDEELLKTSNKITELREKISSLEENVKAERATLDDLVTAQAELNAQQLQAASKVKDEFQTLIFQKREELLQLNAVQKALRTEINKLKAVTDVCPTCGQKLPNVHKVDTSEKERELGKLEELAVAKDHELKELNSQLQQGLQEVEKLFNSQKLEIVNKLASQKTVVSNITKKQSLYNEELNTLLLKYNTLQNAKDNYQKRVDELNHDISTLTADIATLEEEIRYNTMGKVEIENRLDAVNKMVTIATRDFRGFLLTNVIEYINRRAKNYSLDIFETDKIDFILDGNNLNVYYDGKPYENLSGGEQKKVDIIAQLSLRDMLCQFSSFSANLLFLDEMFDALDSMGCNKVIDTIAKRLTDIESVFIVTHRSNLSLPADSFITVIKDEHGVSSIK